MGIEELQSSINSLKNLYVSQFGRNPNADDLINYARQNNLLNLWDAKLDGDKIGGNSISGDNFLANGDTLVFSGTDGNLVSIDLGQDTGEGGAVRVQRGLVSDGTAANSNYTFITGKNSISALDNAGIAPASGWRYDSTKKELELSADFIKKIWDQVADIEGDDAKKAKMKELIVASLKGSGCDAGKVDAAANSIVNAVFAGKTTFTQGDITGDLYKGVKLTGVDLGTAANGSVSGDPHYFVNGHYSYDFQGEENGVFTQLNNYDIELTAQFVDCYGGEDGSRMINGQTLKLKGAGITINGDVSGKFTVTDADGKVIASQATIASGSSASFTGQDGKAVTVSRNGGIVTVTYDDRTITLNLTGRAQGFTGKFGDEGLLVQALGALDKDSNPGDGLVHEAQVNKDLNGDGDKNDVLTYNVNTQVMVGSNCSAISAPVCKFEGDLTPEGINQIAEGFLATTTLNTGNMWTAFDGAFDGAASIRTSTDLKLVVRDTDPQAVKDAKNAFKAMLEWKEGKGTRENAKAALAAWIKSSSEAMQADIAAGGLNAGSFHTGKGYSRSQWNEFAGTKTFATAAGAEMNGNSNDGLEKGIDIDNDGKIDGYDFNHNGILEDNERFL